MVSPDQRGEPEKSNIFVHHFSPKNLKTNSIRKQKYLAEQKSAADKKRQQDLRDQYEREQEDFSNK